MGCRNHLGECHATMEGLIRIDRDLVRNHAQSQTAIRQFCTHTTTGILDLLNSLPSIHKLGVRTTDVSRPRFANKLYTGGQFSWLGLYILTIRNMIFRMRGRWKWS